MKCGFICKNVVLSSDNSDATRICVESLFKRILRINSVSAIYILNLTLYVCQPKSKYNEKFLFSVNLGNIMEI